MIEDTWHKGFAIWCNKSSLPILPLKLWTFAQGMVQIPARHELHAKQKSIWGDAVAQKLYNMTWPTWLQNFNFVQQFCMLSQSASFHHFDSSVLCTYACPITQNSISLLPPSPELLLIASITTRRHYLSIFVQSSIGIHTWWSFIKSKERNAKERNAADSSLCINVGCTWRSRLSDGCIFQILMWLKIKVVLGGVWIPHDNSKAAHTQLNRLPIQANKFHIGKWNLPVAWKTFEGCGVCIRHLNITDGHNICNMLSCSNYVARVIMPLGWDKGCNISHDMRKVQPELTEAAHQTCSHVQEEERSATIACMSVLYWARIAASNVE